MTDGPPRRIAELAVQITFPESATRSVAAAEGGRALLEHGAHTCPVRVSLLDAIAVPVRFDWQSG